MKKALLITWKSGMKQCYIFNSKTAYALLEHIYSSFYSIEDIEIVEMGEDVSGHLINEEEIFYSPRLVTKSNLKAGDRNE